MTPDAVEALAKALDEARTAKRLVGPIPVAPASRDEAYSVQAAIIRRRGASVLGWKVSALRPEDWVAYRSDRPVAGPLLDAFVQQVPARLRRADFMSPLLECEFAFRLGRDLPARAEPYGPDEVAEAVDAALPAFEVADCRVPPGSPGLLRLADMMGNGAFLVGDPVRDWRDLDLGRQAVTLRLDGALDRTGSGARILGDPLLAVVALANAQPLCGPLLAGQYVTTGTATDPAPLPGPVRAEADFGPLGTVRLDWTD